MKRKTRIEEKTKKEVKKEENRGKDGKMKNDEEKKKGKIRT